MKLILVRHGKPNEASDTPGDPPLHEEGQDHARCVAAQLAREPIARIIASPQTRACETAEPLARATGLESERIEGWAEVDYGAPLYRSPETMKAGDGKEWKLFRQDPFGYFGVDGDQFRKRVLSAFADAAPKQGGATVVFAHGLPIKTVISHVLGHDVSGLIDLGYGSLTRLQFGDDGTIRLISIGEVGHLLT